MQFGERKGRTRKKKAFEKRGVARSQFRVGLAEDQLNGSTKLDHVEMGNIGPSIKLKAELLDNSKRMVEGRISS
jgi:hypothetical protein